MALSDNMRGAALMTLGMAAFTANDACMKALSDHLPFWQTLFLRGLAVCAVMGAGVAMLGQLRLRWPARVWGLIGLRALGEVGAAYFFITALFHMPLANATAILQALPLAVTLAGAVLFRERVGWRRWLAIAVGFSGVMLIVRPGAEGFNIHALWALGAVGFIVLRDLVTRRFTTGLPSLFVATTTAAGIATTGGLLALTEPLVPVAPAQWGMLAAAAAFLVTGYHYAVQSMRFGEISLVSPFRYTALLWAMLFGIVVFGDVPRPLTVLGAMIVVGAGVFSFWRERVRRQDRTARRAGGRAGQSS